MNQQTQIIWEVLGTPLHEHEQLLTKLLENGSLICDEYGRIIELNLSFSGIQSLPESVGLWTSLVRIDLNHNALTVLPQSIGNWTNLREIDLSYNSLTSLPDTVGYWQHIEHVDLCVNQLAGLPLSIGAWSNIREVDLSSNRLAFLPDSIVQWTTLRDIELLNNPNLILPAFNPLCGDLKIKVDSNAIKVPIRLQEVETVRDVLFIVAHVIAGYADLATDIISIVVFYNQQRLEMMGLIITFLVLHIAFYLFYSKDLLDVFLTIFQLKPLYEGYWSIRTWQTTPIYASIKKVDAISRSMPSAAVQLFSIFSAYQSFTVSNLSLVVASVSVSVVGCSITLASSDQGSGTSFYSIKTLIRIPFFLADISTRIATVALMFTCIQEAAFVVMGLDFLIRLGVAHLAEIWERESINWRQPWTAFLNPNNPPAINYGEGRSVAQISWHEDWFKCLLCCMLSPVWAVVASPNAILQALVWLGTDTASPANASVTMLGFALSLTESWIFMLMVNVASSRGYPGTAAMRSGGLAIPVTILIGAGWAGKILLWFLIPWVDRMTRKRSKYQVIPQLGNDPSSGSHTGGMFQRCCYALFECFDWLLCGCKLTSANNSTCTGFRWSWSASSDNHSASQQATQDPQIIAMGPQSSDAVVDMSDVYADVPITSGSAINK